MRREVINVLKLCESFEDMCKRNNMAIARSSKVMFYKWSTSIYPNSCCLNN